MRSVTSSSAPTVESPKVEGSSGKAEQIEGQEPKEEAGAPDVTDLQIETSAAPPSESPASTSASPASAAPPSKGRVLFLYTCPSGSPIKFRMVYSSSVRGVQQDATDKAGIEIAGKVRPLWLSSSLHQGIRASEQHEVDR